MKQINLPNFLTLLRVLSVPFFIYFLMDPSQHYRYIAFILFSLASITDLIDGYLARKWKQETEFGKFMDPMADKVLVIGALITFLFLSDQVLIWMVLVIIGRDMLITILRYLAIKSGKSLHTSRLGKVKTAFQMFSIIVILLSLTLLTYKETGAINEEYRQAESGVYELATQNMVKFFQGEAKNWHYGLASFLPFYMMMITTMLTVISGLRYLVANYHLLMSIRFGSKTKEINGHK